MWIAAIHFLTVYDILSKSFERLLGLTMLIEMFEMHLDDKLDEGFEFKEFWSYLT